jgi:23S rRNA pseudouridine2605 synthase
MYSPSKFEITIHEGRKHIIRRIFEEMGYGVTKLTRIQFGSLKLADLNVGKWRHLTTKEVEQLKKAVKTNSSSSPKSL